MYTTAAMAIPGAEGDEKRAIESSSPDTILDLLTLAEFSEVAAPNMEEWNVEDQSHLPPHARPEIEFVPKFVSPLKVRTTSNLSSQRDEKGHPGEVRRSFGLLCIHATKMIHSCFAGWCRLTCLKIARWRFKKPLTKGC